jgi:F0F1-type ATP synthase assembly protein I
MNKQGGMVDLFLFMVLAIAIVFICGIFIYLGGDVTQKVHETMDTMTFGDANTTQVIDDTFGAVNRAYQSLYWIAVFLIVGMVLSIFIGSYLVTTKPIFFIPYFFITIIAVIVSVGLSNAYEQVIADPTLASTFAGFVGANFILLQLPIWIAVIGVVGAVIMFVRMGSKEKDLYAGGVGY